ncbi:unnamed protein product [Rotaria magnacalcarata]|uniref:ADP ribosyltransferase domain-containing protein n=2 Tax=Rotaria magnacalcarata TaxID=392030 RepID=A0A815KUE5_9BILA|nr:unnamed protein product [Rotaria magnacalcarata]CAF1572989.1 unnamed protein product [Rotaria magnacalcarata]CAF4062419.1 unnamed protein product [Rotaria magnacalcarata]CAF4430028.1 unnamed protein product [Rotaria magnacalcarata]
MKHETLHKEMQILYRTKNSDDNKAMLLYKYNGNIEPLFYMDDYTVWLLPSNILSNSDIQSIWSRILLTGNTLSTKRISSIDICIMMFYISAEVNKRFNIDSNVQTNLTLHSRILRPAESCYRYLKYHVLRLITDDSIGMPTMLDRCYQYYQGHPRMLMAIRRFAQKYCSGNAIYWFTKDTFLYRFINKILRSGDVEFFHNLRFYIAHLSSQLMKLKCQQQEFMKEVTVVYRGLRQSLTELAVLKSLVGNVIVTKGFTSTSRDRRVALFFAGANEPQSIESKPLLFEIKVDFSLQFVIAADITHLSCFPEEQEVLFDSGTKFKIEMLTFDLSSGVWLCKLLTMNEPLSSIRLPTIPSIEIYSTQLYPFTDEEYGLDQKMRYRRRHKFDAHIRESSDNKVCHKSTTLLWMVASPTDFVRLCHQKSICDWQQGQVHRAKIRFDKIFPIYLQNDVDQLELAKLLSNHCFLLFKTGEAKCAIDLAERALDIYLRLIPSESLIISRVYRTLGLIYMAVGRIEDALLCHQQALLLDEKIRPTAKWSMVLTLRNIGLIHDSRDDKAQAIKYFVAAWKTFEETNNYLLESQFIL